MNTGENRPEGVSEENEKKSKDSGRLFFSARVLEKNHPAMGYLCHCKDKIKENPHSSFWQTIGSLLNDSREIEITFPFTTLSVQVKVQTYFKLLYLSLFKKARFESSERSLDEMMPDCLQSLEVAAGLLLPREAFVRNQSTRVDINILQLVIKKSLDPFILRTNNIIGSEKLPEEIKNEYIREKVKDPDQREEVIPNVPEDVILTYLYHYSVGRKNLSDIEQIHLYLLFLDPALKDQKISYNFNNGSYSTRIRELLCETFRNAIAVTYYSEGPVDDQEFEQVRGDLSEYFAERIYELVIGSSFRPKKQSKLNKKYPETLQQIHDKLISLRQDPQMSLSDLENLQHIHANFNQWKLPNASLQALGEKIQNAGESSDFLLIGYLNLLLQRKKKKKEEKKRKKN